MELLTSKKFKLPVLYFITDRKDIKNLPVGVPFFYGSPQTKSFLIRMLEYEILYQRALKTGMPFNFKQLLKDAGFNDIKSFDHCDSIYMEYMTDGMIDMPDDGLEDVDLTLLQEDTTMFYEFIKDSSAQVDIQKLKDLHIFPTWVDKVEDAIHTNIHNFAVYNPDMYNKKLDGMYGSIDLTSPSRNLIISDISYSIPKAVGTVILAMTKNMAETFYCDVVITGRDTIFIPYEELHNMDIDQIYIKYGGSQECNTFRKLITSDVRHYKTCIVFGDNHSVCDNWSTGSKTISKQDGKKLCTWEIEELISFHTKGTDYIAGYADWFSPKKVEKIANWVKYLKD